MKQTFQNAIKFSAVALAACTLMSTAGAGVIDERGPTPAQIAQHEAAMARAKAAAKAEDAKAAAAERAAAAKEAAAERAAVREERAAVREERAAAQKQAKAKAATAKRPAQKKASGRTAAPTKKAAAAAAVTDVAVAADREARNVEPLDDRKRPDPNTPRNWSVELRDMTLANTFHRWAQSAGYRVRWDAEKHLMIEAPTQIHGTFEDAVARTLASPGIAGGAYPLEACFYPNNPPLVRITRRGDSGQCQ